MAFGSSQVAGRDSVGFLEHFNSLSWRYVSDFMEDRNGTIDFSVAVNWGAERTFGSCGLPPDEFIMAGESGGVNFDPPKFNRRAQYINDPDIGPKLVAVRRLREVDDAADECTKTGNWPRGKGWTKENWARFKQRVKESKQSPEKIRQSHLKRAAAIQNLKDQCVAAGFDASQVNQYEWNEHGYPQRIWQIQKFKPVKISVDDLIAASLPKDPKVAIVHGVPLNGPNARPWPVSVTIRA